MRSGRCAAGRVWDELFLVTPGGTNPWSDHGDAATAGTAAGARLSILHPASSIPHPSSLIPGREPSAAPGSDAQRGREGNGAVQGAQGGSCPR